jgi:hypothetical protein
MTHEGDTGDTDGQYCALYPPAAILDVEHSHLERDDQGGLDCVSHHITITHLCS